MLDWIFPRRCHGCRIFLKKNEFSLCIACHASWPSLGASRCIQCSYPFLDRGEILLSPRTPHRAGNFKDRSLRSAGPSESDPADTRSLDHLCGDCLKYPRRCRSIKAIGIYRGILLDMIHRMKYGYEEHLANFFGLEMSKVCDGTGADLILPVPMTKRRLRERGYNQSVLLAKTLARILGKKCDPFLLRKVHDTAPQAQLQGEERRKNLRNVFFLQETRQIEGKSVLLVDDVYTTGTTIETLASLLIKAGACEVHAAVVARAGGEPR